MSERKVAFFDIDKTIYDTPVFLPLSEFQLANKIVDLECILNLKTDTDLYKSGNVSYEEVVHRITLHWAEGLKGKDTALVLANTKEYFSGNSSHFYPFVKNVFDLLKATHDIYLVTGEPNFVAEAVTGLFELTGFISSKLSVSNNTYTGKTDIVLSHATDKLKALKSVRDCYTGSQSIAFGDSEGDVEMLNSVEIPVCVNPSEKLIKIALSNNWNIVNPDEIYDRVKVLLTR